MIFLPYADELEIINRIQSIYNEEYILIRLTSTMINKNNLLNEGGILVLEFRYDTLDIDNEEFTLRKAKKYGDKYVYIYVKK